ncbi:MAG TPA: hypothetical protein VGB55_06925 [Tepidisphaeraceae bacterium]|jgi:sialate O-acetylesterase
MAVTIDLGGIGPESLHRKNKETFARRSSMQVLHNVYDKPADLRSGPLYRASKREGNQIMHSFDFSEGLTAAGDSLKPKGFAIAGADRKFVWAQAEIVEGRVVVQSSRVPEPVAVRYG